MLCRKTSDFKAPFFQIRSYGRTYLSFSSHREFKHIRFCKSLINISNTNTLCAVVFAFPIYSPINNSSNFVNFEKWLFYCERRILEDQKDLFSTRHVSTKNSSMIFLSYLDNRLNTHFFSSIRCTKHK